MKKFYSLVFLYCLFSDVAAYSQGYQVNLQGQAQQGMGGAGTAFTHDGASLFFNPGGASFVKGNSVIASVTPTFGKGAFLDSTTLTISRTVSPMGTPFSVYALFGLKDSSKLKFGIAIYTPFGSTIEWEKGWTGRFALTRLELRSIFFQPTISYRINEKFGIGAGFVYADGKVNLQKDLPLMDANSNYGHAELSGNASGKGFNVGVYFQPTSKISIGLTYRSLIKMQVKGGDAVFTVPNAVADKLPSGKFNAALPLPDVTTLGLGYKLNDKLNFVLDINYVGWKAYDTLSFDYEVNTPTLADTKSARLYKNTFAFRSGAQYKLNDFLFLRAGLAYG
ncbi:MAG: outer membrane protein transport protein, partial [Bacteroidia bacterium]|nr:outer membrane protein transport protein [Bacteroidia bacterium]